MSLMSAKPILKQAVPEGSWATRAASDLEGRWVLGSEVVAGDHCLSPRVSPAPTQRPHKARCAQGQVGVAGCHVTHELLLLAPAGHRQGGDPGDG